MGLVGRIIAAIRAAVNGVNFVEITFDPGGGNNATGELFGPPGEDSLPIATDIPVAVKVPGSGRYAVIGFLDPQNAGVSGAGEKRIYARNAAGQIVNEIWLKSDGTVRAANSAGFFELSANGGINLNGVIISAAGAITAPGDVVAGAAAVPVGLLTHKHGGVTTGPGTTGTPIP